MSSPRSLLPRRWKACFAASALVLALQALPLPPLLGLNGPLPEGAGLRFSLLYDLLAPWSAAADRLCLMSAAQDVALGLWLILLGALTAWRRGWKPAAALLALSAAFAAWGVYWERPMAALSAADPELLAVDFHSHTRFSWDGRSGATPAWNMVWHRRAGFEASFVTDHNSLEGSRQGRRFARDEEDRDWGLYALTGSELSLNGLHMVQLGCGVDIDPDAVPGAPGIPAAIGTAHACGGAVLASLPEYWRYHWADLEGLAEAGVDGFEIVNGAPKGLAFPPEARERVLELCRRRGCFTAAASDNHGWGSTPPAWNLLRLPGWRALGPDALIRAIAAKLRSRDPRAVLVAARRRVEPRSPAALAWDPPLELFLALRTLTPRQAAFSLAWLWALAFLLPSWRNRD